MVEEWRQSYEAKVDIGCKIFWAKEGCRLWWDFSSQDVIYLDYSRTYNKPKPKVGTIGC